MVMLGSFVFVSFLDCKEKSHLRFLLMLNWSSINALLTCKRCPLRPLLTPFWSLIKHFLLRYFGTIWFSDSYNCIRMALFLSKKVCFREEFCIVFSASFVVCWDLLKQITDAQLCIRIDPFWDLIIKSQFIFLYLSPLSLWWNFADNALL